jgi:hypothetical protein
MTTAAKVSGLLQQCAQLIDRFFERFTGERQAFMLLVWAGGEVSYISTDGDREKAAKAMREIIAKWEANMPDTPAHERH